MVRSSRRVSVLGKTRAYQLDEPSMSGDNLGTGSSVRGLHSDKTQLGTSSMLSLVGLQQLHRTGKRHFWSVRDVQDLEDVSPWRLYFAQVLDGARFQSVMGVVVAANIFAMVCETNADVQDQPTPFPEFLNLVFLVTYTAELVLRLYVDQARFLFDRWNVLDLLIVTLGVFDAIVLYNVPNIQMLRLARILRLVRAARLLELFPHLYFMVRGLWSCFVAMSWGIVFVGLILLIFSIVAVEFLHDQSRNIDYDGEEFCEHVFDSVFMCMLFFFRTIVIGDSWGNCTIPIIYTSWYWSVFFIGIAMLVQMGVLNLILTVIVEVANRASDQDKEHRVREIQKDKKRTVRQLKHLFRRIDRDRSSTICWTEFLNAYKKDKDMRELLTILDFDQKNLADLFQQMDYDKTGDINYDEFVDFVWKTHFSDVKMQVLTMKLGVDHMLRKQETDFTEHRAVMHRRLLEIQAKLEQSVEARQDRAPACSEQSRMMEEQLREAAASQLATLQDALAQGHQRLLEAVDRRLAQCTAAPLEGLSDPKGGASLPTDGGQGNEQPLHADQIGLQVDPLAAGVAQRSPHPSPPPPVAPTAGVEPHDSQSETCPPVPGVEGRGQTQPLPQSPAAGIEPRGLPAQGVLPRRRPPSLTALVSGGDGRHGEGIVGVPWGCNPFASPFPAAAMGFRGSAAERFGSAAEIRAARIKPSQLGFLASPSMPPRSSELASHMPAASVAAALQPEQYGLLDPGSASSALLQLQQHIHAAPSPLQRTLTPRSVLSGGRLCPTPLLADDASRAALRHAASPSRSLGLSVATLGTRELPWGSPSISALDLASAEPGLLLRSGALPGHKASTSARGLPSASPTSSDGQARLLEAHRMIASVEGMAELPFDRLVLQLDGAGVQLSIREQDLLKASLQRQHLH